MLSDQHPLYRLWAPTLSAAGFRVAGAGLGRPRNAKQFQHFIYNRLVDDLDQLRIAEQMGVRAVSKRLVDGPNGGCGTVDVMVVARRVTIGQCDNASRPLLVDAVRREHTC